MTTPKITPSTRYFLPGTTAVLLLPTVANIATGPTRLELSGGLDISEEIAAITGWSISGSTVATPDLGKRFTPQVNGRLAAAESGFTCWADKTGDDIRKELTVDQKTYVVFLDGGDVPGSPMDTYESVVMSVGKVREIEGAGRVDARFSIRNYAENLVVPAAS